MYYSTETVELTKDCEATAIPAGNKVTIPKGTKAFITQTLGGSFTLQVPTLSGLFRISGKDADAIGKEVQAMPQVEGAGNLEEMIWSQLKNCYDPEIPVNIVDLGLIYGLDVRQLPAGGHSVNVKMTLTAPGCGMGTMIASDARERILALPDVTSAEVEVVWDPIWTPDRISQEGRRLLGME